MITGKRTTKAATTNNFGLVIPAGTVVQVLEKGEIFKVKSSGHGVFYTDVSNLSR